MADRLDVPHAHIPVSEVEIATSRSSGPGGQHANKTESRVEAVFYVSRAQHLSELQKRRLTAKVGERISASAQDERSQLRNRELALERLAQKITRGLETPKRRTKTKPTRGSKERRLVAKKQTGQIKQARKRPDPDD